MPKQTEIPGTERVTDEVLDEKIAEYLEAKEKHESWKTKRDERKAMLIGAIRERAEDLNKNEDGHPVYYYDDGEEPLRFTLSMRDELRAKKAAPPDAAEADIG